MQLLTQILVAALLAFLIFGMYKSLKANPQWLSKEALVKSFGSMGVLALILIAFVSFLIFMVNQ